MMMWSGHFCPLPLLGLSLLRHPPGDPLPSIAQTEKHLACITLDAPEVCHAV
jgi:hypothetical protein